MVGQLITRRIGRRVSRHIVRVHRPTLDLSFGLSGGFPPGLINFTRASPKWVFDGSGNLQKIGNNVLPQDYDPVSGVALGLLIEEERENGIRNNTMINASPGTPGTPPDNWNILASGVTVELVDVGTINGIEYVSYRLSGTPTGGSEIHFETTTGIDALTGDVRTISAYMAIVAGDLQNLDGINFNLKERTEAGAFIKSNHASSFSASLTSSLQRFDATITLSGGGTTAHVMPIIRFNWDGSGDIDITLRIGLPQEEEGAFASSVIKTTNAAVTRSADVVSIALSDVPGFNQRAGTIYVEGQAATLISAASLFQLGNGGANDRIFMRIFGTTNLSFSSINSGGNNGSSIAGVTADTAFKAAGAYAQDDVIISVDGTLGTRDTSADLPVGVALDTLWFGRTTAGDQYWNGHIARVSYWPVRLPDSRLQALSA